MHYSCASAERPGRGGVKLPIIAMQAIYTAVILGHLANADKPAGFTSPRSSILVPTARIGSRTRMRPSDIRTLYTFGATHGLAPSWLVLKPPIMGR